MLPPKYLNRPFRSALGYLNAYSSNSYAGLWIGAGIGNIHPVRGLRLGAF
jgi:hypothetical protein